MASDSYRPGRLERDHPPPLADRMTFTHGGGDTYRPANAQSSHGNPSQFTFESHRSGPRFPPTGPANADQYGPSSRRNRGGAASQRNSRREIYPDNPRNRSNNTGNGYRGRGGFRKPAAPHARALLQQRGDISPEHIMGASDGPNKFLNLDDLSDGSEADMELEDDDSAGHADDDDDVDADQRDGNHKVARRSSNRIDDNAVPRWSNPDPYTVLPPPEETTGKKMDFVKLIRKAKNQDAERNAAHNAVAANDDFISFDDVNDANTETPFKEEDPVPRKPQDNGLIILDDEEPISPRPRGNAPENQSGRMYDFAYVDSIVNGVQGGQRRDAFTETGEQFPVRGNKRKREDTGPPIVAEWQPLSRSDLVPWAIDARKYAHLTHIPIKWLHNEILDFYDFVSPQTFEHTQRQRLVDRVQQTLGPRRFPQETGQILCFGSFPAGLYLPTADMDLVYTSDRHYNGGPPVLDFSRKGAHKNLLYKVSRRLVDTRMAKGQPIVIATAKVPIIKFIDSVTELQVDISFENLSGVQAQVTFDQWKHQYPDMVHMVALLKQFLVMRGLNEVHTGGIGGYSIICLVVSYIQHTDKPEDLGQCFLGFLDYYGNKFSLARSRIQMNPPGVINKSTYGIDGREEKIDGLSIQDPNRLDNNISGGSHKAKDAFRAFAAAYRTLRSRLDAVQAGQSIGPSILECIIGGNYATYHHQRRLLKSLNKHHSEPIDQAIHAAQTTNDEWNQELNRILQAEIDGTTLYDD